MDYASVPPSLRTARQSAPRARRRVLRPRRRLWRVLFYGALISKARFRGDAGGGEVPAVSAARTVPAGVGARKRTSPPAPLLKERGFLTTVLPQKERLRMGYPAPAKSPFSF